MPLGHYKNADPFDNHPLFKTEEQARLEETMDGVEAPFPAELAEVTAHALSVAWPGEDTAEHAPEPEDSLWGRSRDFDWGD